MDSATRTAAPAADFTTVLRTIGVPPIGTPWPEQGGIFLGMVRGGCGDYALILCDDQAGRFEDREWGEYGQNVEGAASANDGLANTRAMAEAGSALAKEILALEVAGFSDWYLPSQADMHVAFANGREQFEKADWYWSSTQTSPNTAWVQGFEHGLSYIHLKRSEFRAVAVRRFVL